MGNAMDNRCVEKYKKKKGTANADLVCLAVEARKLGYKSYGEMQAKEYARQYTSQIKQEIEQKRKEGYMTARERAKLKEAAGKNYQEIKSEA